MPPFPKMLHLRFIIGLYFGTFSGITPIDVHEFLYPPIKEKWQPPPKDPRFEHFAEEVPETEKENYHEETLYHLSNINMFSEGV